MALDVHIVSHTHWDREWYHPVERFRQRLVALIDDLIDRPPSAGESFLLDGQSILIDDYLAVKPERATELATLLRDGRLEAGPWYVLADELIPSGEALVRNLHCGRRTLKRFGAEAPSVLYCPDSFGHPGSLPAIALGFDLPLIVLWRGYGGQRWPAGDTAQWVSPAGDAALLFHLPRDGYEFGSQLPTEADAAAARWQRMRDELFPRATTGVTLIQNGADHHARQRRLDEALDAMERAGTDDGVHRSSVRRFAESVVERSGAQQLPRVRGELRDSYGYAWTLQGTFATRAHQKRLNAHAERLLTREAEPWSALASHAGSSRRAFTEAAWRALLEAHPHDTLCGCSIDEVARAMEARLHSAIVQGNGIRDDAVLELIGYDPVVARESRERWQTVVVVRNPAARIRSGVAIMELEEFVAEVPVGPGSAAAAMPAPSIRRAKPLVPALGTLQMLSEAMRYSRVESPQHYPDNDLVAVRRAAAWIQDAPAYGISTYPIELGPARRQRPSQPVVVDESSLRNAILRVALDDTGAVSLEALETGRRVSPLLELIDESDVGDLYTPAPRPREFSVEFREARCVHRGPLRGELALRYRIVDTSGARRSDADLLVRLTLDADSPFVRIGVTGENRRENHRLRLSFRSDVPGGAVWADAAFGPVRREPIVISDAEAAVEHAPPTAPLHRYVSVFDERQGFTVFSDGLAEYEATLDGSILVTLLRAVGDLSRADLLERPGHAGWPAPTPAAQCVGPFEAAFAVMPHGPRLASTIDDIERAADDVLLPLAGTTLRSALDVSPPVRGVELVGPGLAFSAAKESEDGLWLVLRCVNLREDQVSGHWRLPFDVREAALARLDETIMSDLATSGADVPFNAGPRAIVTILMR